MIKCIVNQIISLLACELDLSKFIKEETRIITVIYKAQFIQAWLIRINYRKIMTENSSILFH